jgi:hypothetical protein
MLDVYAITVYGDEISELGFNNLVKSSEAVGNDFDVRKYSACQPDELENVYEMYPALANWNYPWVGEVIDFASGLTKRAYPTKNPKKRIACAVSHYMLWLSAAHRRTPIIILEHDAKFINRLDINEICATPYAITGLNDPRGATRKAQDFHTQIQRDKSDFQSVPVIDDLKVPQGLAGNSAYMITPQGADIMLDLVDQYGLWPNDALMCRQLVGPSNIGVSRKYYTTVQGLRSTTTL